MLEVVDPGPQTTIQDMGRRGGHALGIPPSGAQDGFAMRIANLFVGNPVGGPLILRDDPGGAGIEILLFGLKLRALDDVLVAITGADLAPMVDGMQAPMWEAFILKAGEVLAFGMSRRGVRAYLGIAGGIDVPPYLGSRSTHVRGRIGGMNGRALEKGDQLPLGRASDPQDAMVGRKLRKDLIPVYSPPWQIRVVPGAEDYMFTEESVKTFYETEWKLNPKSDRTGFRYMGPQLSFKLTRAAHLAEDVGANASNIVIDPGASVGTIQVPSGVEPIVGGVDAPSIGGYARMGAVISIDMSRVGQTRPSESTYFVPVTHEEAVRLLNEQEALIGESSVVR